jgi:D-alanyl-D-alanine carboxypeptidase
VAAVRGQGVTVYATILGSPTRIVRNDDLEALLAWGLNQFRVVPVVQRDRVYATVRVGYGKKPVELVASSPEVAVARVGRPLTETVVAPVHASLPVRRGEVLGHVEVRDGSRVVGRRDLVASRTINKPGIVGQLGWYAGRTVHHLTHLF